jgi:hypothetical protein
VSFNNISRTTEEREKRKLKDSEDLILQGYKKQWEEEGIRLNNKDKGV